MKRIKAVYASVYYLWSQRVSNTRAEQLQKLYVGKSREDSIQCYYRKMRNAFLLVLLAALALLPFAILLDHGDGSLIRQNGIRRQEPGGTAEMVELEASIGGSKQNITVEVSPRSYTQEEIQAQFAAVKQYIQKYYLGANESSDQVTYNLQLDTSVPGSAVTVEWQLDAEGFIEADGSVCWDQLETATPVEITAVLSYAEEQEEFALDLILYPPERSEEEQMWRDWENRQEALAEQTESDKYMVLPQEINGQTVRYQRQKKEIWKYLLIACAVGIVMVPLILDRRIRQRIRERDRELTADYPEMLEQYVLLIGAGMTIKGAWIRIATDYLSKRDQEKQPYHFIYEEMLVTMREMESGMSEEKAYELFGKRVGILSYMKFSTLLVQNLRKGSDDLLRLLEYEAVDAFRERKERAKMLGEEAGTKLLMPMMLMLGIVLVMILYAAFRNM